MQQQPPPAAAAATTQLALSACACARLSSCAHTHAQRVQKKAPRCQAHVSYRMPFVRILTLVAVRPRCALCPRESESQVEDSTVSASVSVVAFAVAVAFAVVVAVVGAASAGCRPFRCRCRSQCRFVLRSVRLEGVRASTVATSAATATTTTTTTTSTAPAYPKQLQQRTRTLTGTEFISGFHSAWSVVAVRFEIKRVPLTFSRKVFKKF